MRCFVEKLIQKHGHTKIVIVAVLISIAAGVVGAVIFTPPFVRNKLSEYHQEIQAQQKQQSENVASLNEKLSAQEGKLTTLQEDMSCISVSDSLESLRRLCNIEEQLEETQSELNRTLTRLNQRMAKFSEGDNQLRQEMTKLKTELETLEQEQQERLRAISNSILELENKLNNLQRHGNI